MSETDAPYDEIDFNAPAVLDWDNPAHRSEIEELSANISKACAKISFQLIQRRSFDGPEPKDTQFMFVIDAETCRFIGKDAYSGHEHTMLYGTVHTRAGVKTGLLVEDDLFILLFLATPRDGCSGINPTSMIRRYDKWIEEHGRC